MYDSDLATISWHGMRFNISKSASLVAAYVLSMSETSLLQSVKYKGQLSLDSCFDNSQYSGIICYLLFQTCC
jgi:hypothetical protein